MAHRVVMVVTGDLREAERAARSAGRLAVATAADDAVAFLLSGNVASVVLDTRMDGAEAVVDAVFRAGCRLIWSDRPAADAMRRAAAPDATGETQALHPREVVATENVERRRGISAPLAVG